MLCMYIDSSDDCVFRYDNELELSKVNFVRRSEVNSFTFSPGNKVVVYKRSPMASGPRQRSRRKCSLTSTGTFDCRSFARTLTLWFSRSKKSSVSQTSIGGSGGQQGIDATWSASSIAVLV